MKNLVLIIMLSLSFRVAIARKPAVEPVRGLSIDHHEKVDQEDAKGFDWNDNQGTKNNAPVMKAEDQRVEMETRDAEPFPVTLVVVLTLLPVGIFLAVSRYKTQMPQVTAEETEAAPSNIHQLKVKSATDEDEEDVDLPKAS